MGQKNKPKDDVMEITIWSKIELFSRYIGCCIDNHNVTGKDTNDRVRACASAIDALTEILTVYTYSVKPYLKYDKEESV